MRKLVFALAACGMPFAAQAEEWEFSLSPYIWLPTISLGSTEVDEGGGPGDGSDVEIGPVDYLDALDFALMLSGDVRKDRLVLMADIVYVDFGIDNKDIDVGRPSGPVAGDYSAGLSGSVFTLSGGWSFYDTDRHRIDGLLGWRRFNLTLDLFGDLDSGEQLDITNDLDFNDGFVGINGRYKLGSGDRWALRYYTDVGTGESNLTWQAVLGIAYAFDWGDLYADFRHVDYDFGDNDELQEVTGFLSGPAFGATFRF